MTTAAPPERLDPPADDRAARLDDLVLRYGGPLVVLTAWAAMLGSLFFSEILHWVPCTLCWYQRIAMYPIAALAVVGLLLRDRSWPIYTVTLSGIGLALSAYHWVHQKTPWFDRVQVCSSGVDCKGDYLGRGVVTIPFLAGVAFVIILFASVAVWRRRELWPDEAPRPWLAVAVAMLAACVLTPAIMWLLPNARLIWLGY
jgi:disulfide bond formation protein DsbB